MIVVRARSGATLIEMLVVVALMGAVLGLVATLFAFGSRTTRTSAERTDRVVESALLSERLRMALTSSARSGNTYLYQTGATPPSDLALSVISTRNAAGQRGWDLSGQRPLYQSYSIFYLNATDRVIREFSQSLAPSPVAMPLTGPQLQTAIGGASAKDIVLQVSQFALFDPQSRAIATVPSNPVGLRWTVTTSSGGSQINEFVCRVP